jgi:hypothetical protein
MIEHGRAVIRQMLGEPDGAVLGPADQSGEPPLALDQWQVAQVVNLIWDYMVIRIGLSLRIALAAESKCLVRVRK